MTDQKIATAADFADETTTVQITRDRLIEVDSTRGFVQLFAEGEFSNEIGGAVKTLFDLVPQMVADPSSYLNISNDKRRLIARALREYVCKISVNPIFAMDDVGDGQVSVGRLTIQDLITIFIETNPVESSET